MNLYFKDFEINNSCFSKVKNLTLKQKLKKAWALVDSLGLDFSNSEETEIIFQKDKTLLRVWRKA